MPKIDEKERKLLELTRQHIRKEKEIITYSNESKIQPINEKIIHDLILKNCTLEDEIRELCAEFYGSIQLQDHSVREQLIKIRDKKSETAKLRVKSFFFDLATGKEHPREETTARVGEFLEEGEKEALNKEDETLQDMIHYLIDEAGWSVDFFERKKEFGTIFVERPMPRNIDVFLNYLKNFYLLNMHEAVIGFSRILLEIACQHIYDNLPEKDKRKFIHMDKELGTHETIRIACRHRLKTQGKNKKEIEDFKDRVVSKYKEASNILHGKLPKPSTEEESLNFVKEVFFIIESLYSLNRKKFDKNFC